LAAVLATGLAGTFLAGAFLAVDTGEAFLGTDLAEVADGLAAVSALAGWVDFLAGMSILEQQKDR
jgi:polyferredoxin